MHVHQEQFNVRTDGKGTYEITGDVQAKIDKCGVRNGAVTVFVHHTSCSLIVMENADPTARKDLEEFSKLHRLSKKLPILSRRKRN